MSQLFDLGPTRAIRPEERADAPVASLSELARTSFEDAHKVTNFDSMSKLIEDGYDSVNDRIKAATGAELENPTRWGSYSSKPVHMRIMGGGDAWTQDGAVAEWNRRVAEARAKAPDALPWDDLIDEPTRKAGETMRKARADQEDAMIRRGMVDKSHLGMVGKVPLVGAASALAINAARDPLGVAAQFGGSLYGQMHSPADAIANLVGFGAGRAAWSLVKNAAANAVSNAAVQSVLSAGKMSDYEKAGLPYGWKVWLEEVEGAAATGAVLDVSVRGPSRAVARRLSPNTDRGGFFTDAPERPAISPETFQKAQEGDVAAAREIAEKTGAINDPAIKGAFDYLEGTGKLTDEALAELEKMGIVRPDGFRVLSDAIEGRVPEMPEPVRTATEPLMRDEGSALVRERAAELEALMREASPLLTGGHPRLAQFIEDAVEAGSARYVTMVREALDGVRAGRAVAEEAKALVAKVQEIVRENPERFAAEVELRTSTSPLAIADSVRRFPDIVDTNTALDTDVVRMGRSIARLDDAAYGHAQRGLVPPQVAAMVAERVPRAHQGRVIEDLAKARPETLEEARALVDELVPEARTEAVPLDGGGERIDDPNGAAAKAQAEVLKQEAGRAYEEAFAPVEERQRLESEVETIRGAIAKMEAEPKQEGGAEALTAKRAELAEAEAKLEQVRSELRDAIEGQPAVPRDPEPTFADGVPISEIRRIVEGGGTYRLSDDAIEAQFEAALAYADALPAGSRFGVWLSIGPGDMPGEARAIIRTLSGDVTFDADLTNLLDSRAFFHPKFDMIVPANIGDGGATRGVSGKADEDVGGLAASGIYHEIVHAHWVRLGDSDRLRLAAHADNLGIMDLEFATFLRVIGNPTWRQAIPGETLRERYSEVYARHTNIQDALAQEAVAHMQELHYAGFLSDAEVAPVLDDLLKMRGGAASGRGEAVAPGSGDPMLALMTPQEKRRSGFHFLSARKLTEVPDGIFDMGGQAVINHLRQAGVSAAEVKHFQFVEKLGSLPKVTKEQFEDAILARAFDFRRKTKWLNPERSPSDYDQGGTRAFTGPRVPGRGLYFERTMAFPKKTEAGETFTPGQFKSPHWEEFNRGTWASWRGSERELPNWGKTIIGEEGQSDYMQGVSSGRRPRVSEAEFQSFKRESAEYTNVVDEAAPLVRTALGRMTDMDWDLQRFYMERLMPNRFMGTAERWEAWFKEVRGVIESAASRTDGARRGYILEGLEKLDQFKAIRDANRKFFEPDAVAKYVEPERNFTPESPIDDNYVRTMVRDLLLMAAQRKADSIAISTSATTARIQNSDKAAHFYDKQLKPSLEKELRRLTGDGSIQLEEHTLPKAMGTPRNQKPFTVWVAKLPDEVKGQVKEDGLPMFALRGDRPPDQHPEPPIKSDIAFVDRLNQIKDLVEACRA